MLDIQTKKNDSELIIALTGRLDTKTAPELDAEIKASIDGVSKLIFDFSELVYISSAGLRVLLSTHKQMSRQGSMVIKNLPEEIGEILEVTGFSDILTIE